MAPDPVYFPSFIIYILVMKSLDVQNLSLLILVHIINIPFKNLLFKK